MNIRLLSCLALILLAACRPPAPSPSPEAPPPSGAYLQMLAVDPDAPERLYAATRGAGLFRREGWNAPWESISPQPTFRHFNAVAVDPKIPGSVLTGGDETGLWLSRDRGRTWEGIEPFVGEGRTILDFALSPDGRLFVLVPEGIYRSRDLYTEEPAWDLVFDYPAWLRKNRQPDWPDEDWRLIRFQKLSMDPHHPQTLLLGARWEGGYHRSDDGGDTWRHHRLSGIFRRVDELHVDPFNPKRYYAFTHHQGLFRSENRGQSWTVAGRGLLPQKRTPYYGVYLLGGVALSPAQRGLMFAGSDYSNWKSEDYGQSWSEVGRTLTCEFVRAMAACPVNPDVVYAGSNVGFFQSRDGGASWEAANEGFPERETLQTLDLEWEGERYRYVLVRGVPAVYRRPLDRPGQFRPLGWLLYEQGTELRFEAETGTLVLVTDSGEIRSRDGGFRWELPKVSYANLPHPDTSRLPPPAVGGPNVVITGAPLPDDRPLLHYYQRPPFVLLQLVAPGYPDDGSLPLWTAHWDRQLSGTLQPPASLDGLELELYVEVRDFQEGTRSGRALFRGLDEATRVEVTPAHR